MKLISLEAHQPPYPILPFQDGLNVLAEKRSPSPLLQLVRFCLGAGNLAPSADQPMDRKFTLTFQVDGVPYTVSKGTAEPDTVVFCGEEISVSALQQKLLSLCFGVENPPEGITWDSLFSQFARPHGAPAEESAYGTLLNRCFLLGLDPDPVIRKKALWDRKVSADQAVMDLRENPLYRPYVLGQRDTADLERKITALDEVIAQWKVSEQYHTVVQEVQETRMAIQNAENHRALTQSNIQNIEFTLQDAPQEVDSLALDVYKAANVEIPELVQKRIDEVLTFHSGIAQLRHDRLRSDLVKQKACLAEQDAQIHALGQRLDELLGYLNVQGALEEYAALTQKLTALQAAHNNLQAYQAAQKAYRDAALDRQAAFLAEDRLADADLASNTAYLAALNDTFVSLTMRFYPDRKSWLLLKNNPGENELRYTLETYIEGNPSSASSAVCRYCLDLTVLLQRKTKMRILLLDRELLAQMEPQQREIAFHIAEELCRKEDCQVVFPMSE